MLTLVSPSWGWCTGEGTGASALGAAGLCGPKPRRELGEQAHIFNPSTPKFEPRQSNWATWWDPFLKFKAIKNRLEIQLSAKILGSIPEKNKIKSLLEQLKSRPLQGSHRPDRAALRKPTQAGSGIVGSAGKLTRQKIKINALLTNQTDTHIQSPFLL